MWQIIQNVLSKVTSRLTRRIYVQVSYNRLQARDIDTGKNFHLDANPEFSHPRTIMGNFTNAEQCLKSLLTQIRKGGFYLATRLLIHPIEKIEGGLTQIEERALMEFGYGAGASKVVVWVGDELSNRQIAKKLD
ncbi:MAG: hypothetical protein H6936_15675 [Burkholderiales bacterium]|nr:hypothetical protein [Nitrosomonas sp.]MCP5276251.1 hypothetical protein [Burkholderiales bacterium]